MGVFSSCPPPIKGGPQILGHRDRVANGSYPRPCAEGLPDTEFGDKQHSRRTAGVTGPVLHLNKIAKASGTNAANSGCWRNMPITAVLTRLPGWRKQSARIYSGGRGWSGNSMARLDMYVIPNGSNSASSRSSAPLSSKRTGFIIFMVSQPVPSGPWA